MAEPIAAALERDPITGYVEPSWSVAGEVVRVMLSGRDARSPVAVARLVHGDPSRDALGVVAAAVDWGQPEDVALSPRNLNLGSYIVVPNLAPLPSGGGTVAIHVRPTLLRGGWHSIVVRVAAGPGFGFGIFIGGDGILAGCSIDADKRVTWVSSVDPVRLDTWQAVALAVDIGASELRLTHQFETTGEMFARTVPLTMTPCEGTRAPLLLGAAPDPGDPTGVRHHLNGLLARPVLLGEPLSQSDIESLLAGADAASFGSVLGAWSLGDDVTGSRMTDRSPNAAHGLVINAPARAVPGPGWNGRAADRYADAPERFDAIHLHDDDLDDARWPAAFTLNVPVDARSGIYAIRVEDVSFPFVVAGAAAPSGSTLVVVPTLSWQAYSTNRQPFTWTEDGVVDLSLGTYDLHADGSPVYYTSSRRPHRAGQPDRGFSAFGAHNITANLHLINWLEAGGFDYDVAADQHLHERGVELLSAYRCVLLGAHPEYWTAAMLNAVLAFTASGGRVMYLGGNGFYWVTSIDPERPWLMEVRKRGEGDFADRIRPRPGEATHSTTLETGGTWASRGMPPRAVVGVEFAANAHPQTSPRPIPFERTEAARDPRYSWIFDGIGDDEQIGGFGTGVDGAGYEMDAVWPEPLPGLSSAVLLARAQDATFIGPRRVPVKPAADLALRVLPGGGATFAAGSVTWVAGLSYSGRSNSISRVTENVLRRFLDREPGVSVLD